MGSVVIRYTLLLVAVAMSAGCDESTPACDTSCGACAATVARVIDGDTIELADGTRIRYIGVDTPELGSYSVMSVASCAAQGGSPTSSSTACVAEASGDTICCDTGECFADQAWVFNEDRLLGREVGLEYDVNCTDFYGRTLAYVWVDGVMINQELLERGYGHHLHIPPTDRYRAVFEAAETAAIMWGRGGWGFCSDF